MANFGHIHVCMDLLWIWVWFNLKKGSMWWLCMSSYVTPVGSWILNNAELVGGDVRRSVISLPANLGSTWNQSYTWNQG